MELPTVIVDQPVSGGAAKYPSLTEHYPDYNQDSSPKRKPLWHEISVIPESQRKGFLGARLLPLFTIVWEVLVYPWWEL